MNTKTTKEASDQYEDECKAKSNLRIELESRIDEFLTGLPYEAKQDVAEAAIGAFPLREKFEQLINTIILALPLKEKISIAEGLEYQVPVRYADAVSGEKQKDSRRSPQR